MNILLISPLYGYSQNLTGSFIHSQAKEYVKQGHSVRTIVPVQLGRHKVVKKLVDKKTKMMIVDGVEVFFMKYPSFSNVGEKLGLNAFCLKIAWFFHQKKLLKGFAPDAAHIQTIGNFANLAYPIKNRFACPIVMAIYGSDITRADFSGKHCWIRKAIKNVDLVTANSEKLLELYKALNFSVPAKVVHTGFNPRECGKEHNFKEVSLIQVSNLIKQKNADVTIKAFSLLKERYPDATLKIVGDGNERESLEEMVRELKLEGSIAFFGNVDNETAMKLMEESNYFVMPSVVEGLGIVYMEAMASGCVAIGTKGEGIDGFIVSEENGILVPPYDTDSIVEAIKKCVENTEFAEKIACEGKKKTENFTWEKNVLEYVNLFSAHIAERGYKI